MKRKLLICASVLALCLLTFSSCEKKSNTEINSVIAGTWTARWNVYESADNTSGWDMFVFLDSGTGYHSYSIQHYTSSGSKDGSPETWKSNLVYEIVAYDADQRAGTVMVLYNEDSEPVTIDFKINDEGLTIKGSDLVYKKMSK